MSGSKDAAALHPHLSRVSGVLGSAGRCAGEHRSPPCRDLLSTQAANVSEGASPRTLEPSTVAIGNPDPDPSTPKTDPWLLAARVSAGSICDRISETSDRGRLPRIGDSDALSMIRVFLRFLRAEHVPIGDVRPAHIALYLDSRLAAYQRSHRRLPADPKLWRYRLTGPIHRYLRLVRGEWPPKLPINR